MINESTDCEEISLYANGGKPACTKSRPLSVLPEVKVYFIGSSTTSIGTLHNVVKYYRAKMGNSKRHAFVAHVSYWVLNFEHCGNGLYFVDISNLA